MVYEIKKGTDAVYAIPQRERWREREREREREGEGQGEEALGGERGGIQSERDEER